MEGSLVFLDVLVSRNDNTIKTSLYRKPTYSDVLTNYTRGLILSLLQRDFMICWGYKMLHDEIIGKPIFVKTHTLIIL